MIPIVVVAIAAGIGHISFAPALMILFRKRYPHWMFHHILELTRLEARVGAYATLLVDEYPSADEERSVHLVMRYPDGDAQPKRLLPLFKWFWATPHYFVVFALVLTLVPVVAIVWLAIVFTGRYPERLFNYVVGVMRWSIRVVAYSVSLVTDRYPPFRLSP